mgnify:CR=1 FL=1
MGDSGGTLWSTRTRTRQPWWAALPDEDLLQVRLKDLGVSVEDREHGVPRIDVLREVPAALRFLSCEPLLGDLGADVIKVESPEGDSTRKIGPMGGQKLGPLFLGLNRNTLRKKMRELGIDAKSLMQKDAA